MLRFVLRLIPSMGKKQLAIHLGAPDIQWSLKQLRGFGFAPNNIMDVGAFRGDWARICIDIFPKAAITCVEPQDAPYGELRKLADKHPNVKIVQTLLGRSENSAPFEEIGPGSSILSGNKETRSTKPMTTIDALVERGQCRPPELLKLDVQGYELEILEGYTRNFDCCQVIQIEISLLPIVKGAPVLYDVVSYLYKRGFVMFDVDELISAPSDGAVWQIDALFCHVDSPLRTDRVWRAKSINV